MNWIDLMNQKAFITCQAMGGYYYYFFHGMKAFCNIKNIFPASKKGDKNSKVMKKSREKKCNKKGTCLQGFCHC